MESRAEIDRDDLVPVFGREILDRADMLDAGVVDQDIQPSERLDRTRDHVRDLVRLRHVGAVITHFDTVLLSEPRACRLDLRWIAKTVQNDPCPLLRHRFSEGQANSAR